MSGARRGVGVARGCSGELRGRRAGAVVARAGRRSGHLAAGPMQEHLVCVLRGRLLIFFFFIFFFNRLARLARLCGLEVMVPEYLGGVQNDTIDEHVRADLCKWLHHLNARFEVLVLQRV